MNYNEIGKFILQLRKEKGYSQNDLARIIPISRQAISKWERGVTIPDSSTLVRLSEIFDVTINELLKGMRINHNTLEELQKTTLDIVDDSVLKTKRFRKRITVLCFILLILSTSFLFYYFINSYNSVKIYYVIGEGKNFKINNGIFITTSNKKYLKIDSIDYINKDIVVHNIKLFYIKDQKERVVLDVNQLNDLVLDFNGYDSIYFSKDYDYLFNHCFLKITYDDNLVETIPIVFKRDFVNNNLLFFLKTKNSRNKDDHYSILDLNQKVINKLVSKNQKNEDSYYDSFTIDNDYYEIYYYFDIHQIFIKKNNEDLIYYINSIDFIKCNNDLDIVKCRNQYYDFLNQYYLNDV